MSTIPPPADGQEGGSDDQPMVLPECISQAKVNSLFKYMFKGKETLDQSSLIAILKLSTMWEIQDGRSYTIENLPQVLAGNAPLQFYLARMYEVVEWVEPAF
ncbi:hypothetical protein NEOLEDRAFT_1176220 [Neolentinus lepideus HHB14362 ss-1]|uniref:BTB domain-containing protein n=1 Tax=Neolentinus lepideus HHB14362 ss-1 TaxID=1314782 RepID=A0A165UF75_9AGAM|nr:hypothetical protein NEOLEDRAFT_1176220 [Neolentinus lepideus HHB14362 ss-1]